jgi:single-strand DNA-binding protein
MNTVSIIGNVVREPELRATTGGTSVCQLSIAVNERRKGGEEYASFLDVDTFGTLADNCALYLTKGRQVAISGRLRQERWETPDGQKRSRVKIVAHDVQFLGARETQPKPDAFDEAKAFVSPNAQDVGGHNMDGVDDDIPF